MITMEDFWDHLDAMLKTNAATMAAFLDDYRGLHKAIEADTAANVDRRELLKRGLAVASRESFSDRARFESAPPMPESMRVTDSVDQERADAAERAMRGPGHYFGGCPTCRMTDGYINSGRNHWFVCHAHKVRWLVGSNLFSDWRDETPEMQLKNQKKLETYRGVDPVNDYKDAPGDVIRYVESANVGHRASGFSERMSCADADDPPIPF